MDLTMARRPKGNYEAYINKVSAVIVSQDEIKKEDKNMTTDHERKAAGNLILKHICMKTVNSYYKKRLKGTQSALGPRWPEH